MRSIQWRLIVEEKRDGYYNMATDEAILQCYTRASLPTLRVYGWDKPFISIGVNQDPSILAADTIPFVRRLTGGSAILHDQEITYSITCASTDLGLTGTVKDSYKKLCRFLKTFYATFGLEALFACDAHATGALGHYGDYCFSTHEAYDLLIGGKKIGGNAQRRKKNLIFQHGSIPQKIDFEMTARAFKACDRAAGCAATLDDLVGRETKFSDLQERLCSSFQETFGLECIHAGLSADEIALRDDLLQQKYCGHAWNHLRQSVHASQEQGSI